MVIIVIMMYVLDGDTISLMFWLFSNFKEEVLNSMIRLPMRDHVDDVP